MATCKLCGKSGLFIKLNNLGICLNCAPCFSQELVEVTQTFNSTLKQIDAEPPYPETVDLYKKAFLLCQKMMEWEKKDIQVLEQSPKLIFEELRLSFGKYEKRQKENLTVKVKDGNLQNPPVSYLRLLAFFLKPRTLSSILSEGWSFSWEVLLKENPKKVIDTFVKNGLIREANFKEKTELNLTINQLKTLLREQNIKPTGNKSDLLDLVIRSVPTNRISSFWQYTDIYICTDSGKVIGQEYQEREARYKQEAFDKTITLLANGNFFEAAEIFHDFQDNFSWPNPLDTRAFNTPAEITENNLQRIKSSQIDHNYDSKTALLELIRYLWQPYINEVPKLYGSYEIVTNTYQATDDEILGLKGYYKGRHFLDYVEIVKQLKREKRYEEALEKLLGCIDVIEKQNLVQPPWFYEQTTIVYRKLGLPDRAKVYDDLHTGCIITNYRFSQKQIAEMPKEIREKYYPNGAIKNADVVKALAKRGLSE